MSLVCSLKEEGANTAAKVKQSAGDEAASFMQHPQRRSGTDERAGGRGGAIQEGRRCGQNPFCDIAFFAADRDRLGRGKGEGNEADTDAEGRDTSGGRGKAKLAHFRAAAAAGCLGVSVILFLILRCGISVPLHGSQTVFDVCSHQYVRCDGEEVMGRRWRRSSRSHQPFCQVGAFECPVMVGRMGVRESSITERLKLVVPFLSSQILIIFWGILFLK